MKRETIYIVIGTRAQLIKMAPFMKLLEENKIGFEFIYTAQHQETISQILDTFKITTQYKSIYNKAEANTLFKFIGWAGKMFFYFFKPKSVFPKKGIVFTHGDTATCAWAAICAKLAGCKVWHIESGLRSYNILHPFPEEIMRLITFQMSDVYFCPNDWAVNNLQRYKGTKINTNGNTLIDSVKQALSIKTDYQVPDGKYVVVSIHRYENIYSSKFEKIIIPYIQQIAQKFKVVFVLHPSTREVIEKNKLLKDKLENKNILLKQRYDYVDFIKLLDKSEFVVTDGGSNQEELSYLGKPTILMRKKSERIEGLDKNVIISGYNTKVLEEFIESYNNNIQDKTELVNSPSQTILDYLLKNEL